MTGQPFTVLVSERDGVTVATVSGEIDFATSKPIADRLTDAAPPDGPYVVDLSAVPFADSSGIRVLDQVLVHCRTSGTDVRFVVPEDAQLRYVLRICAFPEDALSVDLASALAAF